MPGNQRRQQDDEGLLAALQAHERAMREREARAVPLDWMFQPGQVVVPPAKKKEEKPPAPQEFKCYLCMVVHDRRVVKWTNPEDPARQVCMHCYKRVATCAFCRQEVAVELYRPGVPPNALCTTCGTGGKPPLSVKQNMAWKPKSNVVKERSDRTWMD